jgi:threonine/homoserine/homoserine lactone efflux protein
VPLSSALAFWGLSALFVLTPGADWAYAIRAGLERRVVPAVTGLLSGHALATLVVAAGVGALLARLPGALAALTLAGAAYLLRLGVGALRAPAAVRVGDDVVPVPAGRWLLRGFGVSGLNPKVLLLFLALLPQFTAPAGPLPVAAQVAVLGGLHVLSCAVVYSLVGVGARVVLGARPAAVRIVGRCSGVAMVVVGALLILERVLPAVAR